MLVAALLLASGSAGGVAHAPLRPRPAITCVLTNGDRLRGTVIAVTRARVTIRHTALGRLSLARRHLAVCESSDSSVVRQLGALALQPFDTSPVVTVASLTPTSWPTVLAPSPNPVSLDRLINPPTVPLASRALPTYVSAVGWKRTIGSTYALTRGNANASDLGFSGSVTRRAERSQVSLSARRRFGSTEGQQTANFFSATLRYDLALGPNDSTAQNRPSFFTETVYEQDPFAKVARRAVQNTGISVPLSSDPANNLALELGAGITHEAPDGLTPYTRAGGLLRLAARQLFGGTTSNQQLAAFPDLSGPTGHYRLNSDFNISAPIAKSVSLKIGVSNRYDTAPHTNVRKSDTSVQSGIGLEF